MFNKNYLAGLKKEYVTCKKDLEKIEAIDTMCKNKVLNANVFYDEEGERIVNHKYDYELNDNDFITYCKLTYELYKKYGVAGSNYNDCIVYPYEKKANDIVNKIVAYGLEILPQSHQEDRKILEDAARNNYKYRENILNLVLKLV